MAKVALLIGVSEYEPGLNPLPKAINDVTAMQQVLSNAELGGFDEVKTLTNPDRITMEVEVESLFSDRVKDDLVLLFFSGHGVKDDTCKLYFAACNTRKNRKGELIRSTAVPSNFVLEVMNNSRSKRQVVILDCCFSGAFAEDMTAKDDGSVDIRQQLGAEGRAVLTSSTSTQYSFEKQDNDLSIYTHFLVEGIGTGAADLDNDGAISVDELHDYAKQKVQEVAPAMKPEIYAAREGFRIRLASAPSDPTLRYRREVERVMNEGRIFLGDRRWLNQLQQELGLTPANAFVIEAAVQQTYWEYQENLEQYRQALLAAFQDENPRTEASQRRLRQLQERWKLQSEDVAALEAQVAQHVRFVQATDRAKVSSEPPVSNAPTIAPPPPKPTPKSTSHPPLPLLLLAALVSAGIGYWIVVSDLFQPSPLSNNSSSSTTSDVTTPDSRYRSTPIASDRCFIVVKIARLIIRSGPGTQYPQIGTVLAGDKLAGVEAQAGWLKVDLASVSHRLWPHVSPSEAWVGANYTHPCSTSTESPNKPTQ